ncbi:max dimerization protein 4 isoform X5 [Macaca fascicularis]|uniref:max dimerization protein 4 isoform X5 n=1 Tax=Macaca fascicularis TaxID=9541 RepID=UPI003D154792
MELNSLLILLEAAEYLERRDREAEHGYASVLPFDGDFTREKTKAASLVRKAPNNRSSHNELEKHRCSVISKAVCSWTSPAPHPRDCIPGTRRLSHILLCSPRALTLPMRLG